MERVAERREGWARQKVIPKCESAEGSRGRIERMERMIV